MVAAIQTHHRELLARLWDGEYLYRGAHEQRFRWARRVSETRAEFTRGWVNRDTVAILQHEGFVAVKGTPRGWTARITDAGWHEVIDFRDRCM